MAPWLAFGPSLCAAPVPALFGTTSPVPFDPSLNDTLARGSLDRLEVNEEHTA